MKDTILKHKDADVKQLEPCDSYIEVVHKIIQQNQSILDKILQQPLVVIDDQYAPLEEK